MNVITNTLKKNLMLSCYLQTQTVYEIKTEDVYEDFYKDKNLFHFSDYSQDSKFYNPVNKKVIGKMKDEFKGKIISEFVKVKNIFVIAVESEEIQKSE